jgi:hypothetical protein
LNRRLTLQKKIPEESNRPKKVGLSNPTTPNQHRHRRQINADRADALEVPYRDVFDHRNTAISCPNNIRHFAQ